MEALKNLVEKPQKSNASESLQTISDTQPTQRQRQIALLAEMARKLKGLPTMATAERDLTVQSWEIALRAVPDEALLPSYEIAAQAYTDPEKPFGVPHILKGFELWQARRQREQRAAEIEAERGNARENYLDRYACPHCHDKGAQFVKHSDGNTSAKTCYCKGGSSPLTVADGWQRDDFGYWFRPTWFPPKDTPCPECGVMREGGNCEMCDDREVFEI